MKKKGGWHEIFAALCLLKKSSSGEISTARLERHSYEMLIKICDNIILEWPQKSEGTAIKIRLLQADIHTADFLADSEHLTIAINHLLYNSLQNSSIESETIIDIGEIGNQLFIKVIDCGCGVNPEIANRIFDPFFTTFKKRNGLGLSIVKKIAEEHGGTVTINNNRYSPGCTAEIRIPFLPDDYLPG